MRWHFATFLSHFDIFLTFPKFYHKMAFLVNLSKKVKIFAILLLQFMAKNDFCSYNKGNK